MDVVLLDGTAAAIRAVSKRTQTLLITENSRLVEDLALDSLDLVGVLMRLEDELQIKVELDDLPDLQTVGELAAHLARVRGPRTHAA